MQNFFFEKTQMHILKSHVYFFLSIILVISAIKKYEIASNHRNICLVNGNIFNIADCTKIELFNILIFDKMTIVKVKLFLFTLVLNKKNIIWALILCRSLFRSFLFCIKVLIQLYLRNSEVAL